MIRALLFGLAALAWISASPAAAAAHLFSSQAPLKIILTAPFRTLVASDKEKLDHYPATLQVTDGAEPPQTLAIQVRARGLTRRTAGFCAFPPIQLDFGDKASVHGTLFKGQHKLKLVTYCRDQDDYEQRIILEYLAYRLYNVVTPASFQVRPAEVTYRRDSTDQGVTRFGFLVEAIDDLADRNKSEMLSLASRQLRATQFNEHAAARAALFEFMISNLDWDFLAGPVGAECCHNSRFIATRKTIPLTGVVPIAYDFDYSGFVDSPYSSPPEGLPVNVTTERLYRGYCASTDEIPSVVAEFSAHRAEMMALINDDPRLNDRFRAKTVRFMNGFFDLLADPGRVQSQIVKRCR